MPSLPAGRLSKLWGSSKNNASDQTSAEAAATASTSHADEDAPSSPETSPPATLQQTSSNAKDRSLANDIETRRQTNEKLYVAAEAYQSHMSKKKTLPFELSHAELLEMSMTLDEAFKTHDDLLDGASSHVRDAAAALATSKASIKDKAFPIGALGIAMASCAAVYLKPDRKGTTTDHVILGRNEEYASHLVHLSAVHLALAQIQEQFATKLSDSLLANLARSQASIDALKTAEKGLESAKEKMEMAEKRLGKAKGDKERRERQEEARQTRAAYEQANVDLETRALLLQGSEQSGPDCGVNILGAYVGLQMEYLDAQREILIGAQKALYGDGRAAGISSGRRIDSIASSIRRPLAPRSNTEGVQTGQGKRERAQSSPRIKKVPIAAAAAAPTPVDNAQKRPLLPHTRSASNIVARGSSFLTREDSKGGPMSSKTSLSPKTKKEDVLIGAEREDESGSNSAKGKSRFGSLGVSLGRSTSSFKNDGSSSNSIKDSASEKDKDVGTSSSSRWKVNPSSFLKSGRGKTRDTEGFQTVSGDGVDEVHQHGKQLSHVKEGSASKSEMDMEDILVTTHHPHARSDDGRNDVGDDDGNDHRANWEFNPTMRASEGRKEHDGHQHGPWTHFEEDSTAIGNEDMQRRSSNGRLLSPSTTGAYHDEEPWSSSARRVSNWSHNTASTESDPFGGGGTGTSLGGGPSPALSPQTTGAAAEEPLNRYYSNKGSQT